MLNTSLKNYVMIFRYSFMYQDTSIKRQQREQSNCLRVKLSPVTTSLTIKGRSNPVKRLAHCPRTQQKTCWPIFTLSLFYTERQAEKLWITNFRVFWSDSARESNPGLPTARRKI